MDRCDYDGPSSMSIVGHLEKSMETLRRGVSNRDDDYVGRTVEGMTVHRRCLLETLRNRVSDRHDGTCRTNHRGNDGPSHMSVEGHLRKSERPLGIGSLTTRTVV